MVSSKHNSFMPALFIAGLLFIQGCSGEVAGGQEAAPDFSIDLFDGGRFQLSAHRGKAVVINFFASWCVSCGKETPILEKVAREYDPTRVTFLGIAVDDTEKKAKQFMRKIGLTIPAGLDRTGEIKEAFGLYGMPTTFFIDGNGMVSYFHAGVVTEQLMKHELSKLL